VLDVLRQISRNINQLFAEDKQLQSLRKNLEEGEPLRLFLKDFFYMFGQIYKYFDSKEWKYYKIY
jgi:hypothetical protein